MNLDLSKIVAQLRALWTKLPARRQLALVGGALGMAALVAWVVMRAPTENWAVLFSGLAPDDAGRVLEALKAQNAPYRLESGGTVVQVPEARVHELRIAMAS